MSSLPARAIPADRKEILANLRRYKAMPKRPCVSYGSNGDTVYASDVERTSNLVELSATLGTRSADFMSVQLHHLGNSTRAFGQEITDDARDAAGRLNAALALVAAISPADELEAAIAVQMASPTNSPKTCCNEPATQIASTC